MQTILLAMAEWNTEYEDKGLELLSYYWKLEE